MALSPWLLIDNLIPLRHYVQNVRLFGAEIWIWCWHTVHALRGVYSDTTQHNWTQLTQLNSVQPSWSQSCFCLWRHDLQTESTGSLRSWIGDSCSRCERVDNSTSSWVELSCVAINGPLVSSRRLNAFDQWRHRRILRIPICSPRNQRRRKAQNQPTASHFC